MRILFYAKKPQLPSFRFRVQQLLPTFEARDCECRVVFASEAFVANTRELLSGRYDAVFVQKVTLPLPMLALLRARARTLIYDVDDAIMFNGAGRRRPLRSRRFRAMARRADLVVCGNRFLANEVREACGTPIVVPTCIDTERFHPRERGAPVSRRVVIGWTGTRSNNSYLSQLFPTLARLGDSIELRILSADETGFEYARLGRVQHTFTRWTPENEVREVARFDIGLMPLPDMPYTRGKCAFKALQYMALGIPALASPVGVNREIITNETNGFLPANPEAWYEALSRLIDDPELRTRVGAAGRELVTARFSLQGIGPKLVDAVEHAAAVRARGRTEIAPMPPRVSSNRLGGSRAEF